MKFARKNVLVFGLSSVFGLLLSGAAMGQYYDSGIDDLMNGSGLYNHPTGEFAKSGGKSKITYASPSIQAATGSGATIQAVPAAPVTMIRATPSNTIYMSDEYEQGEINPSNGNIQNAGDLKCHTLQKHTLGFETVFDTGNFRTSSVGDIVEINMSATTLLLDDAGSESIVFKCTVTQGASSKPCSHTEQLSLAASIQPGHLALSSAFSYTGFAKVKKGRSTSVKIEFATVVGGGTAKVCSSNLNVRYR